MLLEKLMFILILFSLSCSNTQPLLLKKQIATIKYPNRDFNTIMITSFNRKGQKESLEYDYNDDGLSELIEAFYYNEEGLLIKSELANNAKLLSTTSFEYDQEHNLISQETINEQNNNLYTNQRVHFHYDLANHLILQEYDYGIDDKIETTITHIHSGTNGKKIEILSNNENNITQTIIKTFNIKGLLNKINSKSNSENCESIYTQMVNYE
ncbi:hypothetical protein BVY03_02520 [bacterium K02(2017)]|nr:hypothetical protein BVY03_02520 [bacterium K02(2017)]